MISDSEAKNKKEFNLLGEERNKSSFSPDNSAKKRKVVEDDDEEEYDPSKFASKANDQL